MKFQISQFKILILGVFVSVLNVVFSSSIAEGANTPLVIDLDMVALANDFPTETDFEPYDQVGGVEVGERYRLALNFSFDPGFFSGNNFDFQFWDDDDPQFYFQIFSDSGELLGWDSSVLTSGNKVGSTLTFSTLSGPSTFDLFVDLDFFDWSGEARVSGVRFDLFPELAGSILNGRIAGGQVSGISVSDSGGTYELLAFAMVAMDILAMLFRVLVAPIR